MIDLASVRGAERALNFADLIALLRHHRMVPVAARGGSPEQMIAAFAVGLVEAPDGARPRELLLAPPQVIELKVEMQLPPLPPEVIGRAAMVRLVGDSLQVDALEPRA